MTGFGELLRQARDAKGVSLREAERSTRISRNYLAALEEEEFADLPAATYARGIVRNYAQYLGLDPAGIVKRYEEATGSASETFELTPATGPLDAQSHWAPNFAMIAFMVVMSAVVFAWMYSAYFQDTGTVPTSTVGVATMTPMSGSILGLVTPQATVPVQGGGSATPTPTPVEATTLEAAPTEGVEAPTEPAATPESVEELAEATEPVSPDDATPDPATAEPVGTGAHTFVIWVDAEVWVQVTLDGVVVFDGVLPADSERIYYGDSAAITSGNAANVRLWVDGEDLGTLGDTWNATFAYP
jgi:cytoskeleton protein RodZ